MTSRIRIFLKRGIELTEGRSTGSKGKSETGCRGITQKVDKADVFETKFLVNETVL